MRLGGIIERYCRIIFLVPPFLALCCFINTTNYSFVSDDRLLILDSAPILQDWHGDNMERLFSRDIWSFLYQKYSSMEGSIHSPYYRPLFWLFMMINYSYSGLNPVGWHLTGILLHMIAAMLAYWLLKASLLASDKIKEEESYGLALLGAVFFAIHPAQSESVAWIAAYMNALSSIFIMGALLAYLRTRRNITAVSIPYSIIGALFYVIALLIKEIAIIVPVIIVAYEVFIIRRDTELRARLRSGILAVLPFLFLTICYMALRIKIFGSIRPVLVSVDSPDMAAVSWKINFLTLPSILLKYVKILVWPIELSPIYPLSYLKRPDLWNFFMPLALLVGLAIGGLLAVRRSIPARIGFIWLIVPLLPMLDIRSFNFEFLIQDRYLYLSLIGVGLLFACFCQGMSRAWGRWISREGEKRLQPSVAIIVVAVLIGLAALTIKQNSIWRDEMSLWTRGRENVPNSCAVNMQLGFLNEDADNFNEAVNFYEQVVSACPNSARMYYRLGILYGQVGNIERSEAALERVLTLHPGPDVQAMVHFNLGVICEKRGEWESALKHYKEGLALDPTNKNAVKVRQIIDELMAKQSNR